MFLVKSDWQRGQSQNQEEERQQEKKKMPRTKHSPQNHWPGERIFKYSKL